jgi:glycosyltransferase involved in cell wall biosynthesis
VVLPYTSATQSGVIPIAAAFARPVVATDVGGLPEQLADGRCGVVVPAGNAEALAAAVVGLLTDPGRAATFGAALRHEYTVNRSWERIAAVVGEVCRRAAAAPPHRR